MGFLFSQKTSAELHRDWDGWWFFEVFEVFLGGGYFLGSWLRQTPALSYHSEMGDDWCLDRSVVSFVRAALIFGLLCADFWMSVGIESKRCEEHIKWAKHSMDRFLLDDRNVKRVFKFIWFKFQYRNWCCELNWNIFEKDTFQPYFTYNLSHSQVWKILKSVKKCFQLNNISNIFFSFNKNSLVQKWQVPSNNCHFQYSSIESLALQACVTALDRMI